MRYQNIDKSAFKDGRYIGYSKAGTFWIIKINSDRSNYKWLVRPQLPKAELVFYARTLADVSAKLASFEARGEVITNQS